MKIRCKGWHTTAKKMFSAEEMGGDELTINPDGRGFVNVNSTSPRLSQYYMDIEPLPSTHFKDKNGKEIYEGDILHDAVRLAGSRNLAVYWSLKFGQWMVEKPDAFSEELYRIADRVEVIGNIYENPDLL